MLPPPTLSFTIPSVHDGLVLHCRVYHPTCLAPATVAQVREWRKRAAIVAHPYAPLGGCYDDPVVDRVATTILKEGFIVGTFNFRGAGNSKGRTSWKGHAEQNDYISFIGFMVYYLHRLSLPIIPNLFEHPNFTRSDPEVHNLSPIPSQTVPPENNSSQYLAPPSPLENPNTQCARPCLLLGGYSYGSLITASLPPMISSIVAPFQTPIPGSPHAEIRMRSLHLANQQNEQINERISSLIMTSPLRGRSIVIDDHILHSPKIRRSSGGVRMGGQEDLRRASHDSYRSRSSFTIDSPVRKSIDKVRAITKPGKLGPRRHNSSPSVSSSVKKKDSGSDSSIEDIIPDEKSPINAIPDIGEGLKVAYLLVSPLKGWVNTMATMNIFNSMAKSSKEGEQIPDHEMKFTIDPTLAIFGDNDGFVGVGKLRTWVAKLTDSTKVGQDCKFRYKEVPGAGHFWHSRDSMRTLIEETQLFVTSL